MFEAALVDGDTGYLTGSPVEIRVMADSAQLPLLRVVAETVALSVDLTVDEASDVRLAVDEAASLLIAITTPRRALCARFVGDDAELRVRVSAVAVATVTKEPGSPDFDGFSWQILQRLTDSVVAEQDQYDVEQSGYPTFIEFSRSLRRDVDRPWLGS